MNKKFEEENQVDMTRKKLEEYRSKRDEIQEIQLKLTNLGEGESLIGHDTILDYQTGYPRPQSIIGYDYDKEKKLKKKWEERLDDLSVDCLEVELWIEEIPESLTRRIFRLCFVDGINQKEVAKTVHLAQSNISRKIENYLKSHSMHKEV